MLEASVIIPTHNRRELLEYCILHILNQTIEEYEVLLIDDASTDNTAELISKLSALNSKLKYIRLKKQSGPYVARNIGIEKARGEIIIFIDSDVLVHPRFVEDHIRIQKKQNKIILQGMVHHIAHPNFLNFRFFLPNAIFFGLLVSQNTSVQRKYLIEVGGFDKDMGGPIGFKDIELGLRLEGLGLRFSYGIRTCRAYHIDKPYSRERLSDFFHKNYERGYSAACFVRKHGEKAERIARTERTLFFSRLFNTDRWVERESTMKALENLIDSPIIPLFPFWRKVARYHYRAKGIKKALCETSCKTGLKCSQNMR